MEEKNPDPELFARDLDVDTGLDDGWKGSQILEWIRAVAPTGDTDPAGNITRILIHNPEIKWQGIK